MRYLYSSITYVYTQSRGPVCTFNIANSCSTGQAPVTEQTMTVTTTPNGTIDITSMIEDYRPGESRVGLVIGLTVTFCALAIILASARIYVRYWLLNAFGKDDCFLLGALAMTLANGALGLWATQTVGLGRHVVDIVKYGPPLNLDTLHLVST